MKPIESRPEPEPITLELESLLELIYTNPLLFCVKVTILMFPKSNIFFLLNCFIQLTPLVCLEPSGGSGADL